MYSIFLSDDSGKVDLEMGDRYGIEVDGVGLKLRVFGVDLMFLCWCKGNRNWNFYVFSN